MSRVDVIIPCYNYGRYLGDCVRSVLSQTAVDLRVLILDDTSTDNSVEVAKQLAADDSRIELRLHETNRGHITTYNEGLEWASGEYLLLLSADDLLTSGALSRATRLLDSHPEVGFVYGKQITFVGETAPAQPKSQGSQAKVLTGSEFLEWCCSSASNPVATPTVVARTSLQHELGGYKADLPHTADLELWLRFAAHAGVGILEDFQAFKRGHQTNMQHQYLGKGLGDLPQRLSAFDTLFLEWGNKLENGQELRRIVYQRLGEDAFWAAVRAFELGDDQACQEMLDVAVELYPALPNQRMWSWLRWKRRIGYQAWRVVRPLVGWFRPRSETQQSTSSS